MVNKELNDTLDFYMDEKRKKEKIYKPFFKKKKEPYEILSKDKRLSREEAQHLLVSDEKKTVIIQKVPWYIRFIRRRKAGDDLEKDFEDGALPEDEEVEKLEKELEQEMDEIESEEEVLSEKRKSAFKSFIEKINTIFGIGPRSTVIDEDVIEDVENYEDSALVDFENDVDSGIKKGKYVKLRLYKPNINPDIKRVLNLTDSLLAKLPKEDKISFMQTPEFDLYKAIFKKYRIKQYEPGEEPVQKQEAEEVSEKEFEENKE